MKCGFCERIKKLRKLDVILMLCICLFLYIGSQMQKKEMQTYKEQSKQRQEKKLEQGRKVEAVQVQQTQQEQESEPQKYEDLQRQCYFKSDKKACEELKKYQWEIIKR